MGSLTMFATAVMAVAAASQPRSVVDPVARWRPIMTEASVRYGVPTAWIERVMRAESDGLTTLHGRPIRSPAGAIGLMQIMPSTWAAIRDALHLGSDPDDPHDNIMAGTFYLRLMANRFGYPGLFAAYNAGPARYAAYLAGGGRLPSETIAYLNGVTSGRATATVTGATKPRALLFALNRELSVAANQSAGQAPSDAMFAIRKGLAQ